MARASGSARAAVCALRNRYSSEADQPPISDPDMHPVQTVNANTDPAMSIERETVHSEYLLEAYPCALFSDSESSNDEGARQPPRRTSTSLSMEDTQEFASFVERRVAREVRFRETAYVGESRMRRVSDPHINIETVDLLGVNQCATWAERSDSESEAPSHVRRSLRVDSMPAASEYLSPKKLKAALKDMEA
eukprot:TRINITY_DN75338_c0_g1_i1.p1 TRINITY_DN75338_c0_g1~~TRINITY_DN75338_c0_g1_i1.p1  ORF type:complete len:192 (+),score=24.71 TRINITY_DN75338_c0_g1_i1:36-611(+)